MEIEKPPDAAADAPDSASAASSTAPAAPTRFEPDLEWYFAQQIHPAILRLTECVVGMDAMTIADCLGMDTAKYRETRRYDTSRYQFVSTDVLAMESKFKSCIPLVLRCRGCHDLFELPPSRLPQDFALECCNCHCPVEPIEVRFRLQLLLRQLIARHFSSPIICDDPLCTAVQGALNLKSNRCINPDCRGTVKLHYDAESLYIQLIYLKEVFMPQVFKHFSYGHLGLLLCIPNLTFASGLSFFLPLFCSAARKRGSRRTSRYTRDAGICDCPMQFRQS
jgi:DNA polymerase alpha subunit A